MNKGNYLKFFITLAISFITMYSVMYLNVDQFSHIYISLTRFYMTLLMITPMAILMLLVMKKMYMNKKLNLLILLSSLGIFILAFALLRTQTPITDRQYIKAMIPHHSSAILNSKKADIYDPELKKLSEQIIRSQEEEIAQMKNILKRIE